MMWQCGLWQRWLEMIGSRLLISCAPDPTRIIRTRHRQTNKERERGGRSRSGGSRGRSGGWDTSDQIQTNNHSVTFFIENGFVGCFIYLFLPHFCTVFVKGKVKRKNVKDTKGSVAASTPLHLIAIQDSCIKMRFGGKLHSWGQINTN